MATPVQTIKKISQQLLNQLDVSNPQLKVVPNSQGSTQDISFFVNITTPEEESGVLIGHHGETIAALQLIISLMVQKKLGHWHRLVVDINGYRDKREQNLKSLAETAADKVIASNEEVVMPPMASFDRRIIHLFLADNKEVKTESVGEGKDRRLIIYPAKSG